MKDKEYPESIKLLIKQLSHENRNANLYFTFSGAFIACGLVQLAEYFHERALEERNHMDWIINYLRSRSVCYTIPAVPIAEYDNDKVKALLASTLKECPKDLSEKDEKLIKMFVQTVVVERETTDLIKSICEAADKDSDYLLKTWLTQRGEEAEEQDSITDTDEGQLLREQDEEESLSLIVLNMACQDCDWLTKEQSILQYYNKR